MRRLDRSPTGRCSSAAPTRALLALAALGLAALAVPPVAPGAPAAAAAAWAPVSGESLGFALAMERAEKALAADDLTTAADQLRRALERDPKSLAAWRLRARWAAAAGDEDEQVFSLHRHFQLARAQGADRGLRKQLLAELAAADAFAPELVDLEDDFVEQLAPVAEAYEKDGRPHSAIRVHKQILALDPDRAASSAAIERIAASPDPSLAADAKPKDLLADVSAEWVREFDAAHATWKDRAKLERPNYWTYTDAGYEVLVRSAEAMEQMNAFYRRFFRYGTEEDGGSVPRISLHIFKDRDEYLEKGIGPPVEWSAGHFTGNAVETYTGDGGFEGMVGTLFHEAAHQFVSLATSASGWLNEGLASFFEGTRILANGTVIMNLPANHRLFPLATRMEEGWMESADDGLDPGDPNATPTTAPTFRIILENRYAWGPPWYAPTWGVVYFLYNYQDPVEGRFVYRDAFAEFIDSSGGRAGDGAVENFEAVVLANPSPPTPGAEYAEDLDLPQTVAQLDAVWKAWILALRDEQTGQVAVDRPYLVWAANAITRGELAVAAEHFEAALVAAPGDLDVLEAFADFLAEERGDEDRAARLVLEAIRTLESAEEPDEDRLRGLSRKLGRWDDRQRKLERIQDEIEERAASIAGRYLAAGMPRMAMDVSWRLGTALELPALFAIYRDALEVYGSSPWIWRLAYNEEDLEGWVSAGNEAWKASGTHLDVEFESASEYDYRFLALDTVTSGDFSVEAAVRVDEGAVAFAGLVFGKKSDQSFHGFLLYPPRTTRFTDPTGVESTVAQPSFVDLASFYGGGAFDVWRHSPVSGSARDPGVERTETGTWHTLRIDVVGTEVDAFVDGEFIASQSFTDPGVLRGAFGLITAPGKARFREVRYLDRPARDPGAVVERRLRLAALEAAGGAGGAVSGSWLGKVPPLPRALRWAGEPLETWTPEDDPRATLVALWSTHQNGLMPLDEWLRDLEKRHGAAELRLVSVVSGTDDKKLDGYLAEHPWPGYLALDDLGEGGIGLTFEDYSIDRFSLPRLLLLDVDGRVVWEGDPGFRIGSPWIAGDSTYLDGPLGELLAKRRLVELRAWATRFERVSGALREGQVDELPEVLAAAAAFDGGVDARVARAEIIGDAIRREARGFTTAAAAFEAAAAEPALEALVAWGAALGVEYDKTERKALDRLLKADACADWGDALRAVERAVKYVGGEREVEKLDECEAKLETLSGDMVAALLADLRAARAAGGDSEAALRALLAEAATRPARWLATEFFRF